jgi:chaperonin GroES
MQAGDAQGCAEYSQQEELTMKLRPMADNVLLKATEAEETTSSGIILATTSKEKPAIYEVVAAGEGTKDVAMTVKVGDKVVVGKYTGSEIKNMRLLV